VTTIRRLIAIAVVTLAAGCGGVTPASFADPIDVTGKVTLANGAPVKSAVLHLQPTGDGRIAQFPLGADGTFRGQVTPGEYTYYLAPVKGDSLPVPDKYRQGSLDRRLTVRSGSTNLDLKLE
jgi:hypothetical protein